MADEKPDWLKILEAGLRGEAGAKCFGCGKPIPSNPADAADWALFHFLMFPVGCKCPDCQTPEQRAETAIRQATGPTYHIEGFRLVEDDQDDHPQSA